MRMKLKPVEEQVMVITGADSGIGLATARAAAERGARLVLNSRHEEALAQVAADLRSEFGADVEWRSGDVADLNAMLEVAEVAIRAFGRIDTWVNNAGVSIYGVIEDVPVEDARRLFDTNYFGVVNGSLAALPYLRAYGGALINVGSVVSDQAIPLQGHYSASKHAVKGFTNALRMEVEKDGAPVVVTLVKPSSIDTPYTRHARSYMDEDPDVPPPVYDPELVADAILHCAEHPQREVTVGGGGRMMAVMGRIAPRMTDRVFERTMFRQQKRRGRPGGQDDTLYSPPLDTGREHGDYEGHVAQTSAYTTASLHPGKAALALGAFGLGYLLVRNAGTLMSAVRPARERPTDEYDIDVQVRGPGEGVPVRPEDRVIVEETVVVATVEPGDGYGAHSGGTPADGYGPRGTGGTGTRGDGYGF
ncbi:MAG TPA: SDR family oxidoreductase [Longimicrobium sp.]|nr:SDR family oxidoreductase [Longimicrobium sp.]